MAGDGKVYGIPYNAESVLIIDPAAGTTDTSSMTVMAGNGKWNGGVLAADGKVYGMDEDVDGYGRLCWRLSARVGELRC